MSRADAGSLPVDLRSLVSGLSGATVNDDQQWLLDLMRKNGLTIISLLWRMLGSREDVLDAYQTAVCRLAARGKGKIGSNRAGYFYRTAMNAGIEIMRNRKRRQALWPSVQAAQADRRPAAAPAAGHQDTLQRLRRAIATLPPHLRNVVALRDLGEMPYRKVARLLGITCGTARLYRRQAILRLAEQIGQEESP